MASTKTEHLTSLSFNLTDMKAQLDSIPASVQEAALKAQKAWDDNFNAGFSPDGTMGSGAGGNGGGESGTDRKIAVTTDAVNRLIDRYTALQEKLAGKAFTGDQFSAVRTEVEQIINDLNVLKSSVEKGFDLDENDSDGFVKARSRIVELNTELKQANILALDFKNKVGGQSQQLSTSEYEKLISKLQDIRSQFGATQSQAQNAKWGDANVRQLGETFGAVKGRVSEYITSLENAGVATQEDAERVRALEAELKSLGIVFDEAANTAKINYAAEQQRNALIEKGTLLTDKQGAAIKRLENSRQKSINRDTIASMKSLNAETANLIKRFKAGEISSDQFKASLDELIAKTRQLEGAVRTSGTGINDFFTKISDKAKWLASFYLIQGAINAFKALISTVKETEQTVVELQRVLNDDVSSPEISSQLYDIAYEYGRTFEEVQESAVLFAQTGKSWNDVLTLTRGTMLALNTAELDVTQATQGLIAVMAQWQLQSSDYVELIDKINKTADDYAITSEAIVAAMQRSGGTAKAYGMTLDELIGVITALGEATGRTGENLGTAINSLITYTTRAKSIDVLEQMGIQAKDAEGNLLPVLDIWSQLAQKIKGGDLAFADFMATDQEAMSGFLSDSEEYKQAVDATIAKGQEVQDAYSIAGTYRKNYFIALLNNLGTAEEAVRGMTDAEGYSVTENEKYMATLTAISNQLTTAWKQLAVALGDAGFLEALKWVAELGIGLAKLIGNTGGLKNALSLVLGILIMIKAQKIQEFFTGIGASVKALTTGVNAAGKAVSGLQLAFGWIGLAITAISLLVGGFKALNAAMDDSRRKTLDEGASAREASESIGELIQKYKELANTSEYAAGSESALASAKSIHEDIVKLLGDQAQEWDLVNGKVDENIAKLRAAQLENAKTAQKELEAAKVVADSQLNSFQQLALGQVNVITSALKKSGNEDWRAGANAELQFAAMKDGAEGVLSVLREWQSDFLSLGEDGADALAIVSTQISYYEGLVKDADVATKNWAENEALVEALETQADGLITNQSEFDNYIEILNQAEIQERVTAEYADALREAIANLYPEFSSVESAAEKLENALGDLTLDETLNTAELAAAAFKDTQDQVNEFSSSMETLNSVVSEYNETGTMTTEMLNSLLGLSSEYLALLDVTAGGLSVNKDATDDLIDSKQDLIKAMIDEKFYMEAAAIASEYAAAADKDKWAADVLAASGSRELGGSMWEIVSSAASAATSVEGATNSIYNALIGMGYASGQAQALANKLGTVAFAYRNVSAAASGLSLGSFGGATATTPKASGGGGGGGEDPQIKILEDRKKAIEETAQAQIDALKEVQEAEDRKRRRDEYLADKSEALADVRRAQSRSGIEAREDEADAEKKLAETNKDWQEQLQDWNLDDQIASIEEWKDAMVDAIDAQIEALQNAGGGGSGGGGGVSNMMATEAEALQTDLNAVLGVLSQVDSENLPEKMKEFYDLFNASKFTEDVDFAEQLNGIKADWDTFTSENGDDWAIHYKMTLDDGTTMTPEQINDYINGLLGKATSESELLQLDKEGLGILLRVTPEFNEEDQSTVDLEQQYSDVINALGESLGDILDLARLGDLDLTETQAAIENAFGASFDVVQQSAIDAGSGIQTELTTAMDNSGAGMLTSVNLYAPQIADAWKQGAINPMITSLGDLSTALDDVLLKLGSVASFNGLGGIGGIGSTTNNTNQSQNNFFNLRGQGTSQINPLTGFFRIP